VGNVAQDDGAKPYNMPGPRQLKFPTLHPFVRAGLDSVLTEPLPDGWKELLRQIHERERQQSASDPTTDEVHHDNKSDE